MLFRSLSVALFGLIVSIALPGCASSDDSSAGTSMATMNSNVPMRGEDTHPLGVGDKAPAAALKSVDEESIDLGEAYRNGPVMLIFYRGGWCPYCNTHLADLRNTEKPLRDLGITLIAVSPDMPEFLRESREANNVHYQLLSDSDMVLAREFGLAFRVDDATIEKYHGYGIDLEKASGRSHFLLPVPAVYLIDREGVIRFAHFDPDYKTRLSAEEVIAAARAMRRR